MKCIFLSLLLAWGLTATAQAADLLQARYEEQKFRLSRQLAVVLKPNTPVKTAQEKMGADYRVIASEGSFLIVETNGPATETQLHHLRKLPFVALARRDSIQIKQTEGDHCVTCPGQTTNPLDQTLGKLNLCRFSETCNGLGLEKLWAQSRIDADLMNEDIEDRKLRKPGIETEVAVIDTGFSEHQKPNMMRNDKLIVEAGVFGSYSTPNMTANDQGGSIVGTPNEDEEGHGTMVAGVIGGKDGIGVAPHARVSSYRVTKYGGSTPQSFIEFAVRRACRKAKERDPDATPIINVSWGGRSDESGDKRDETEHKPLMDYLSSQGCLVTKAAGNDSFRSGDPFVNGKHLDDSYLRVGGTNSINKLADFSSAGEVQAPGEMVFTLQSAQAQKAEKEFACFDDDKQTQRFVNGTSFSAPIAAGIASEVVGVLRSGRNGKFGKLTPPQRLSLLNRILSASTLAGSINGLRAIHIADIWNQNVSGAAKTSALKLPSTEELKALLKSSPHPVCSSPESKISLTDTCTMQEQEFKRARRKIALCEDAPKGLSHELVRLAVSTGSLETGLKYYALVAQNATTDRSHRKETSKLLSRAIMQRWQDENGDIRDALRATSPELVHTVVGHRLEDLDKNQDTKEIHHLKKIVLASLLGSKASGTLVRGPGRGSEETITIIAGNLSKLADLLPDDELKPFVNKLFESLLEQANPKWSLLSTDNLVTLVRVYNAVAAEPKMSKLRKELDLIAKKVSERIDQGKWNLGKETDKWVFLFETHANISYLREFFDNQKSTIHAEIRSNKKDISPIKLAYGLTHIEEIFPERKAQLDFALRVSHTDQGKVADAVQDEISSAAIGLLKRWTKTMPAQQLNSFVAEITDVNTIQKLAEELHSERIWQKLPERNKIFPQTVALIFRRAATSILESASLRDDSYWELNSAIALLAADPLPQTILKGSDTSKNIPSIPTLINNAAKKGLQLIQTKLPNETDKFNSALLNAILAEHRVKELLSPVNIEALKALQLKIAKTPDKYDPMFAVTLKYAFPASN